MKTQRTRKPLYFIFALLLMMTVTACATSKKRPSENLPSVGSSPETIAGVEAHPTPADTTVFVAQLGEAYGYATAGILLRASEERLRVDKIYASGTSSLMAALFAISKNRARYEWALQKVDLESAFEEAQGIRKIFRFGSSVDKRVRKLCDETLSGATFEGLSATKLAILVKGRWVTEGKIADAVYESISAATAVSVNDLVEIETQESGRLLSSALTEVQDLAEMKSRFNGQAVSIPLLWNSFAPPTYHEKSTLIFAGKESFEAMLTELKDWPRLK